MSPCAASLSAGFVCRAFDCVNFAPPCGIETEWPFGPSVVVEKEALAHQNLENLSETARRHVRDSDERIK